MADSSATRDASSPFHKNLATECVGAVLKPRTVLLLLLILLAGLKAVHAKEIDQKFLDIYLEDAFAASKQLIKFSRAPSISIYCGAEICAPAAKRLNEVLRKAKTIDRESEGSDANIEILLYSDKDDRPVTPKYFAKGDEKVYTLFHSKCFFMQSRRGFEVVKVIVVATAASGTRENIICVLNEVLRGAGVSVQGRYPEYLKGYLGLDESQFAVALNGFSLLMATHSLEVTHPGQDETTVEQALQTRFNIGK